MSRIDIEDVRTTAALARLSLSEEELQRLTGELEAMLDYVAELQALDTTGVEPLTHAVPFDAPLRADEVRPSLELERALAAAPRRHDRFFEVPAIIEAGGKGEAPGKLGGRAPGPHGGGR